MTIDYTRWTVWTCTGEYVWWQSKIQHVWSWSVSSPSSILRPHFFFLCAFVPVRTISARVQNIRSLLICFLSKIAQVWNSISWNLLSLGDSAPIVPRRDPKAHLQYFFCQMWPFGSGLLAVFLKTKTTNETYVSQTGAADEVQTNVTVRLASPAGCTVYGSMHRAK